MNVVVPEVSSLQTVGMVLVAASLLVYVTILWKIHLDSVPSVRPIPVLVETLSSGNSIARRFLATDVRIPARAPPTYPLSYASVSEPSGWEYTCMITSSDSAD